jgi:hypothetical protein
MSVVLVLTTLVSVSIAVDYRSQQLFERNFSSLQLREFVSVSVLCCGSFLATCRFRWWWWWRSDCVLFDKHNKCGCYRSGKSCQFDSRHQRNVAECGDNDRPIAAVDVVCR